VLSFYDRAKAEGANVVLGGGVPSLDATFHGGSFVQPTIWTGLPETSTVIRDEIFGPCCHIAPFDSEEEAIALANDSPYGLATSIWTENLTRAHRVAAQIEVGITWVNSWFLRDLRTPFGGSKQSGIGPRRRCSLDGILHRNCATSASNSETPPNRGVNLKRRHKAA